MSSMRFYTYKQTSRRSHIRMNWTRKKKKAGNSEKKTTLPSASDHTNCQIYVRVGKFLFYECVSVCISKSYSDLFTNTKLIAW